MKLTTKQLRKIIIEELNEVFAANKSGSRHKRAYDRMKAGIEPDDIRKLSDLEHAGSEEDRVAAYELANLMGSEEDYPHEPLKHDRLPLLFKGQQLVPKYVKGTIRGIQNIPPKNRIDYYQRQGVDLDQYMKAPMQNQGNWEPMHINKEQLVASEYKFLYDQLWSYNWKKYPKIVDFENDMQQISSKLLSYISREIDKHIQSGAIREINGILYNPVPRSSL